MFGALKTVEDHNLYASFGLIDNLEENELQDINGGWCACDGLSITLTITTGSNTTGSNNGNNSGNGNGSGNSGGSSGSSSSSSSS